MERLVLAGLAIAAVLVWGCVGSMHLDSSGDDDAADDDAADDDASGDDDAGDDDAGDDDAGDDDAGDDDAGDDDVGDDDVGDDDDPPPVDPDLVCGPIPDLYIGNGWYEIYTGDMVVEVDGSLDDHWHWRGCESAFAVGSPGHVDCGVKWHVEGWSSFEDPGSSMYQMELEFVVAYDTCGGANGYENAYRVWDISGSWTLYEIEYYSYQAQAWRVLDDQAPGEIQWDPSGSSGEGWIQYVSEAF